MATHELLVSAINRLPLPGAPPRFSRTGASIGLAFLEMAIRQNHVRRITETLEFEEHLAAARTIALDVGLGLLDDLQLAAGQRYSRIRDRRSSTVVDECQTGHRATSSPLIWVAIARHSKASVYPVEVVDAAGVKVPRLTQYETSRLVAAGMYRLLRHILQSDSAANKPGSLNQLLYEESQARWLLQSAMLTLFHERSAPQRPDRVEMVPSGVGFARDCRSLILDVLGEREDLLAEFMQLLDLAVTEYVVVVGLPTDKGEHHLSYGAPLRSNRPSAGDRLRTFARHISPFSFGYRIKYSTSVPANMRSYHVVANTLPSIQIERMTLECNSEERDAVSALGDLRDLTERNSMPLSDGVRRLHDLEIETTALALSQMVRRRQWDLGKIGRGPDPYLNALQEWSLPVSQTYTMPVREHQAGSPSGMDDDSWLSGVPDDQSGFEHYILGVDLYEEDDPASNKAHVYWRRSGTAAAEAHPLRVDCTLLLGATGPVNVRSISVFTLIVFGTLFSMGTVIYGTGEFWTWGGDGRLRLAGAVITVMLLVPGFLYTRLDTPRASEISARVQMLPRVASYVSIGTTAVLAGYVATDPRLDSLARAFWMAGAIEVAALTCLLIRGIRSISRLRPTYERSAQRGQFDATFSGQMGS